MREGVFEWGTRVALSPEGIAARLPGFAHMRYGIVLGQKETVMLINVVRDGTSTANWYHIDFWRKIDRFPWEDK